MGAQYKINENWLPIVEVKQFLLTTEFVLIHGK
jgi:hypothetical protein